MVEKAEASAHSCPFPIPFHSVVVAGSASWCDGAIIQWGLFFLLILGQLLIYVEPKLALFYFAM